MALLLTACEVPGVYRPPRPATGGPYTFYVSPDGDDGNDGMSPAKPWRTLDHADGARFRPGDRLRLKGGERFRGSLTLDKDEAGSARKPVVVESYGTGRATIVPRGTSAVTVHDTAGLEFRDLSLVGDREALREGVGISVTTARRGARRLDHIRIADVEVKGFRNGITLGAVKGARAGFSDVRISDVSVHHNLESGLSFHGPVFEAARPAYAHEGLRIERVKAYANAGNPRSDHRNTGSGITLGSVRNAKVTHSVAHDNGSRSAADADEGPEGMWVYDSTEVVLEHNRSYRNRTGSRVDGGGFGLDNNVSSSVVQYNIAYGNDGPGFLVYSGRATGAHRDNVVRYNMSWDDARKLPEYGGIVAYGLRMRNLAIYHNTVVMRTAHLASAAEMGMRPPAVRLRDGMRGVRVENNIIATDGGPLVATESAYDPALIRLRGNNYRSTGPWSLEWGERRFAALDAWRAASGQETLDGRPTGSDDDLCLSGLSVRVPDWPDARNLEPRCAPRTPVTLGPPASRPGLGELDYFGNPLPDFPLPGAAQPGARR
ncbi:right-handed parallel beta-helix repeat-containing protein [Streptomyces sp. NPDC000983]|uniref:right-handed parallel beta-helix repeat-containing protein n=1 Tax=Streptomyces sp. NPDC000983 TaxID=3154373 RepID=UPI00332CC1ED